jgi:hypothetical protein
MRKKEKLNDLIVFAPPPKRSIVQGTLHTKQNQSELFPLCSSPIGLMELLDHSMHWHINQKIERIERIQKRFLNEEFNGTCEFTHASIFKPSNTGI